VIRPKKNLTCALEVHGYGLSLSIKAALEVVETLQTAVPNAVAFCPKIQRNNNPSLLLLHTPVLALAYKLQGAGPAYNNRGLLWLRSAQTI